MGIHFVTFSDKRFSMERIKKQAILMNLFDTIHCLDEDDLEPEFWKKHCEFMKPTRGFGYWIWKSQVTKQVIDKLNDGDILIYADTGCHLNVEGIPRLKEYIQMATDHPSGILSISVCHQEHKFTKADTMDSLGFTDIHSDQLMASTFVLYVCENSRKMVHLWNQIMESDYHLIDDSPSILPNSPGFIDHRHDQSVWSCIRKKYGTAIVPTDETYGYNLNRFPIHVKRDKVYKR